VATGGVTLGGGARRTRLLRAEIVLLALTALSLILLPVHIKTAYSGLPAHPLLLHVPVMLVPLVAAWALVLAARPGWIPRQGVWLAALGVLALASTILTMGAGEALRDSLGGGFGPDARLIDQHAEAADKLRLLVFALTLAAIAITLAFRRPLGLPFVDRILGNGGARATLRVALAALAIGAGYFVFHTGDLGAKAVWQDRLDQRGPGPPGD
jgi:hypothetical protein